VQPLKYVEQNLDLITKEASFPLKFLQGTRKLPVTLKFTAQVQLVTQSGKIIQSSLESAPSNPFIVITNESQWEGSEELLLKKDSFQGNAEIPWIQFCNTLQRHFFRATRQDSDKPFRILTPFDLNYIHQRFFASRATIDQNGFDEFWRWFGKTLQAMRYQRYMSKLWQNGLTYGFMNRTDVENSLKSHTVGTFIIRFSETCSGRFAIAYVGLQGDGAIRHYLVSHKDTSTRKTLADFLCEYDQFIQVLQLVNYDEKGLPMFQPLPKTETFKPYLSPSLSNQPEDNEGYDPLENPLHVLAQSLKDNKNKKPRLGKRKLEDM